MDEDNNDKEVKMLVDAINEITKVLKNMTEVLETQFWEVRQVLDRIASRVR